MELYPVSEWGGPSNHTYDLIKGFYKLGHKVIWVTSCWEGVDCAKDVCTVIHLPPSRKHKIMVWKIPFIAKLIREHNIELVHTHGGYNAWIALAAVKLAGQGKVVNTWHSLRRVQKDPIHRWFYRNVSFIAVSDMLKELMVSNGLTHNVYRVHNGIDVDRFSNTQSNTTIREQYQIPAEAFVLGFIGRIDPDKGVSYAVKAIDALPPNVYLLVIGWNLNDEYFNHLKSIANERVKFCGPQDDVVPYLAAIDVLVLPSIVKESFGLVITEAMAQGKPVISTNTGGQKEIIEDGISGYIIDAESASQIADKVTILMTDPALYRTMSEKAKDVVRNKFSLEIMAQNTIQVFNDVLNK